MEIPCKGHQNRGFCFLALERFSDICFIDFDSQNEPKSTKKASEIQKTTTIRHMLLEGVWKASGNRSWSSKWRQKGAGAQLRRWPGGKRRPVGNLLEGARTGKNWPERAWRQEPGKKQPEKTEDKHIQHAVPRWGGGSLRAFRRTHFAYGKLGGSDVWRSRG